MAHKLTLIVFPGGFNWPVWVAQDCGMFARQDLEVDVATTPGSVYQWTRVAEGDAQIAITLMDNVIAYREGQGANGIVVPDAIALMGLDTRSMPALITAPDVSRYAGLKGRTLAVDALLTGNALVLRGMLERGGLATDDYRLEQAGGVAQRFDAMRRGEYAGSLFNAPLDALLADLGFTVLDNARTVMSRFQGHVVAARRRWAEANRAAVVRFLRAILQALAWLYDGANRDEAFALYRRYMDGATMDAAAAAYGVLFHPQTGFPPRGDIDVEGIRQVLALRERYGEPSRALGDASAFYDRAFLAAALHDL